MCNKDGATAIHNNNNSSGGNGGDSGKSTLGETKELTLEYYNDDSGAQDNDGDGINNNRDNNMLDEEEVIKYFNVNYSLQTSGCQVIP